MAKNDLDDLNLDDLSDLDLDMSDPFEELKNKSRLKSLTQGILAGAGTRLKDVGFYTKLAKRSLPRSFNRAIDNSDHIKFAATGSYNKIASDFKSEFKAIGSILPDNFKAFTKEIEQEDYQYDTEETEEYNQSEAINTQLRQNEKIASTRLKRDNSVDRMKIRGQSLQIERLTGISDRLTASLRSQGLGLKLAEKNLEIGYKHYNVALKTYELIHNTNKNTLRALADIIRNTSLPDSYKQGLRNEKMGFGSGIKSRLAGGISSNIKSRVTDIISTKLGMYSPMLQSLGMLKDTGGLISPWEIAGNIIGDIGIELGGEWASDKISSKLSDKKGTGPLGRYLGNASSSLGSRGRYALANKRFSITDKDTQASAWLKSKGNDILENFGDIFELDFKNDASDYSKSFNASSNMTVQTNKSLNVIIPGYLSRILREVTVANTGDQSTKLLSYSISRDKFVTDKRQRMDTVSSISKFRDATSSKNVSEIPDILDPENQLSPSAKRALSVQLLHGGSKGLNFYGKNFTDESYYHKSISGGDKEELMNFFKDNDFDSDKLSSANEEAIAKTSRLREDLDTFYTGLDKEIEKGNLDILTDMGFITRGPDGQPKYNERAIYDFILNSNGKKNALKKVLAKTKEQPFVGKAVNKTSSRNINFNLNRTTQKLDTMPREEPRYRSEQKLVDENLETYRSTVTSLLSAIKMSTEDTEKNTREIKVYVGDDINATVGAERMSGKRSWLPGFGLGRKLLGGGVDLVSGTMSMYGSLLRGSGSVIGSTMKAGGLLGLDAIRSLTNVNRVSDIYLADGKRKHPILLARDLKQGMYFDSKTGKVVKKIKDIKEQVIDSEGNVVVKREEVPKLYVRDKNGVVGKAANLIGGTFVNALKPGYFATKVIAGTARVISDRINRPKDIYVKGESEPRLLAIGLKSGTYFSKLSGKPITSVDDIDGPVIDFEGNVVISLDDIRKGLVGRNGKPIESLRYRAFKAIAKTAFAPVKFGFKAGMWSLKTGFRLVGKLAGLGGSMAKGLWNRLRGKKKASSEEAAVAQEGNAILLSILTLLDERLPNRKKKFNDTDGDGYREGSYLDKVDNKEDSANDQKYNRGFKDKLSGASISSIIGSALAKFRKQSDDEEDDGDNFVNMDFGGDGKGDDKDKKNKGRGRKGRLGRMAGKVKGLFSKIPGSKAMGAVARAGGSMALRAGAVMGAGALIGSGTGVLSAIGTGLAAAGAAVAGVVSAPVVLGALAVGAVALGGYGLYKYLDKKSDKLTDIIKIRLQQYGIDVSKKEQVLPILKLEKMLVDKVLVKSGVARINISEEEIYKVIGMFNINTDDVSSMERWLAWFSDRFKPVFLTYINGLSLINPKIDITECDDLKDDEKIRLLQFANFDSSESGPLGTVAGPFGLVSSSIGYKSIVDRDNLIKELENAEKPGALATRRGMRYRPPSNESVMGGSLVVSAPSSERRRNRSKRPTQNNNAEVMRTATNLGKWGMPTMGTISSPFGDRVDPFTGKRVSHGGVDFAAAGGTPVYSANAGVITRMEYSTSYGNVVYINHGDGKQSRYAHLSRFNNELGMGDWVEQGTLLGYVGNTGRSKGNHLHFEIVDLEKDKKLDPLSMINDKQAKDAKKELAKTEKEIKEEKKFDNGIEGLNTLASTIEKKPVADIEEGFKSVDHIARLATSYEMDRKSRIESEARREKINMEKSRAVQNSIDKAVDILRENLDVNKSTNQAVLRIGSHLMELSKAAEEAKKNAKPEATLVTAKKQPTSIYEEKLPVSNTRPT